MNTLVKHVINNGGDIFPLILPANMTGGTGLMNPSVLIVNGKVIVNVRHVNYTFYHSEAKLFQHPWGPLTYIHPENDMHLRTTNYYCELNDDFSISKATKINTSRFDTYEPLWDFVGLEDARLVNWDNKLYVTGVRRDTTTNGQGRMELCEIVVSDDDVVEVSRFRIPPPKDPNSYCEKNWMPILDLPYHYVKWSNPTEVVQVDPITQTSRTVHLGNQIGLPRDLRGGSQVITLDDYYVTLTHEVDLFNSEVGRKDALYRHRFVVWDKSWNFVKVTKDFSIMGAHVEFSVGMCIHGNDILITFGYQDNAAFILKTPIDSLHTFINANLI
jgi:hypothetical protein